MKSRYQAILNNVALSSISDKILILDIKPVAQNIQDSTFRTAKRDGARINRRYIGSIGVTISFGIYEYNTSRRQDICADIARWAKNGGVLETNDRPGQYLQCVCSKMPVVDSARDWTKALQMTFMAYEVPYWQEKAAASATITGTSATGSLYVPGNADGALVEVSAKANASLSGSVVLGVNGRTLTLSGLSLSANDVIRITYDTEAIQSIKVGNTSLLDKRTGVDDLLANCGENNALSLTASASVSATFSVRGLWV